MPAELQLLRRRTVLILAALALTFVLGLWLPYRVKKGEAERALTMLEAGIDADESVTVNLAALGHQIVTLRQTAARFDKTVPRQPALPSLLGHLTAPLEAREVTDLNVDHGEMSVGDAYTVIPITLSFQGSFETVFAFLRHVESSDRLIQVNGLIAKGNPRAPDSPLVVDIELTTFCMPAKGVPGE